MEYTNIKRIKILKNNIDIEIPTVKVFIENSIISVVLKDDLIEFKKDDLEWLDISTDGYNKFDILTIRLNTNKKHYLKTDLSIIF